MNNINGIHHITAIASDPAENLKFYTETLGLRFVKKTINFDAPDVYHLYYGYNEGRPGTALTFFPFPDAARGSISSGQASTVIFSIVPGSFNFWIERLAGLAVNFNVVESEEKRAIQVSDPDGLRLELLSDPDSEAITGWRGSAVNPEHTIRKFYGVKLVYSDFAATESFLSEIMNFRKISGSAGKLVFGSGEDEYRSVIELEKIQTSGRKRSSAGSIHHIAFRVSGDDEQLFWQNRLREEGYGVTGIAERCYFRSIYFREPGGVLFEIATDGPGFIVDEDLENLGSALKLPPWYESNREAIEAGLTELKISN